MMDYYQTDFNNPQLPQGMGKGGDAVTVKEKEKIKTNVILYIGGLPPNIDNYEVHQLLTSVGNFTIESMNIKKIVTGESSYAYVKLGSKKEVEEAKQKLHLMTYNNSVLKADFFQKEEKRKNKPESSVLFSGFPYTTEVKEIVNLFSQFGEISLFKPSTNITGKFSGKGLITYVSDLSAISAIDKINGTSYNGNSIKVMKYSKSDKKLATSFPVVIIKNIPINLTDNTELKNILTKFAEITLCHIFRDSNEIFSHQSTEAIALLPSPEEVEKCLINSRDPEINHLHLEFSQAEYNKVNFDRLMEANKSSLKSKYGGSNLIVKNLPKEINDKELNQIFSQFGPVKSAKISKEGVHKEIKDSEGNIIDKQFVYESRGYGFVLFVEPISAQNAIQVLEAPFIWNNISLLLKIEYFNYDLEKKEPHQGKPEKNKNYKEKGPRPQGYVSNHINKFNSKEKVIKTTISSIINIIPSIKIKAKFHFNFKVKVK